MPSKDDLIRKRKQELLSLGYKPGIVDLAMEWAYGCAEGIAHYVTKSGLDDSSDHDALIAQFLPQYLEDCDKWIQSFGHRPGDVQRQS